MPKNTDLEIEFAKAIVENSYTLRGHFDYECKFCGADMNGDHRSNCIVLKAAGVINANPVVKG